MNDDQFEQECQRSNRRWRNRRRIAHMSFIIVTLCVLYFMLTPFFLSIEQAEVLSQFTSIIVQVVGFNSSVVMLYMGAATYDDSNGNRVTK